MKFMHIADLHIGKQLYHYNMKEEQKDILNKIISLAEKEAVDGVLIAGDIYDKSVPSAESVAVFDEFLSALNQLDCAVFLVAGNHDSAERIDYASSILAHHRVHIAGVPPRNEGEYLHHVMLEDAYGPLCVYLLPFVKPLYVRNLCKGQENISHEQAVQLIIDREDIDTSIRNVIVAHQFFTAGGTEPEKGDSELLMMGGIDKVDVSVLDAFDYGAFGHIHRAQRIGADYLRYAGTPLAYSVKEADAAKSVTIVELRAKGSTPIIRQLPLEPLHRIRVLRGTMEEVLSQASDYEEDYVSITLTDEKDPYKPKERLEAVYKRILTIQVDNSRTRQILSMESEVLEDADPLEVFESFYREVQGQDMNEAEIAVLMNMLNRTITTEE